MSPKLSAVGCELSVALGLSGARDLLLPRRSAIVIKSMKRVTTLLSFLAACSVPDPGRDASVAERSLTIAKLTIARDGDQVSSAATAQFVRYRGLEPASVPSLLGVADVAGIELGTCRSFDGTAALDQALAQAAQSGAEIALLDAGRLELAAGGNHAAMSQHAYPDVMPFVAGMVYGLGPDMTPAPGQLFELSGDGGEDIGPFSVSVLAPSEYPHLSAGSIVPGSDLELSWQPLDAASEPLLIELKWPGRKGTRTVRCQVFDEGKFRVPAPLLAGLSDATQSSLTATRSARSRLSAPGASSIGQFAVELRDTLQKRSP